MDKSDLEFQIIKFDTLSSTLDEAAKAQYVGGEVIVADMQTCGRGQRGNKWHSKAGQNLMFTLVIAPRHVEVVKQFAISMATALSVVRALKQCGVQACVKWPNDIYVGNSKICGILIEHSFSSEFLDKSIIGVGINVSQTVFDPSLANPTSLKLLGVNVANGDVLHKFLSNFQALYRLTSAELLSEFMACLYRRAGVFEYQDAGGRFFASIVSIDPASGRIEMKDSDGNARHYLFKEVQYI